MAEIVVSDLRKEFGAFTAVQGSSFTVRDGEFFMLLGPSGCGKTTTLRMIAGLELPTSGTIAIDGEDVSQRPARQRDIAFVFQMFALYPHMNVRRNIAYPLVSQGMSRSDVAARVAEVAGVLRIEGVLDSPVGGLSGGDRQRVALARAIVRRPKAFMMDEPLGALDSEFREEMAEELRALHDRIGATTVYVTHDQLEAMQMGDKIVVMNHGVIEQFGAPQDIYDHPATLFVADFIGSPPMNLLRFEGAVAPGDAVARLGGASVALPALRQGARGALALGARPEHVRLGDDGPLRGRIEATEYLGTTQIVTVETGFGRLRARLPAAAQATPGEHVGVGFVAETLSLFDAETGRALRTAANEAAHHG
ncbi:ABC transporter ATP-binding protein [Rubrimonas cliftonensis]|uniref:Carbohydrate ABC transporter ATP-binding protein, CUT1 family n=1 Tax=Rubrimonas cliftonensis TaxID=89524 RepID=A0A1H4A8X2_9RHOB|nr:ABC transporter ATP-binding protein [Rubrimonas cliftonensis]SEA32228.1 carbohydrate ABC transporter ATP-binding protein, CUT1 family [Rubrimonas cliftonensis]